MCCARIWTRKHPFWMTLKNGIADLQVVVIITVMFAFVSMVAGIFGQNLHFSSTETSTVSYLIQL